MGFLERVDASLERMIGCEAEMRQLHAALRERRSQLIWGPPDTGKTFLLRTVLAQSSLVDKHKCVFWDGPATRRQLVEHLVGELFRAGDSFVRLKVGADCCSESAIHRWVSGQSATRLRGILFTAAEHGDYRLFLDHLPPVSRAFAALLKEIINRTNTPVYLTGRGYSRAEIGHAWSVYWADEYRLHLGPLQESCARELLETCIERFALTSLDLDDFREGILRLSGHVPGAIVRMCKLAANTRYHYRNRVKLKLVHVDYLLQRSRFSPSAAILS